MQLTARGARGAAADLLGPWSTRAIAAGFVLVALTLLIDGRYLAKAGMIPAEEHFRLGENLHATGTLSLGGPPAFFRPPGFPVFVATVLHARDLLGRRVRPERAVLVAHACLLSLGALVLYLHAARERPLAVALAVGALYAFHPLALVLARALTYPTLHILLVTVATLGISEALKERRRRLAWALAAGALWGAATLVRPVSLILPPFVVLLALWEWGRGSWGRALRFTGVFTLGMAAVIGPYTLRNYRLTHRLIVVNAQDGYAFWGLSATRNPAGDFTEWANVWGEQGLPIFDRVSGGAAYTTDALYDDPVELNDAFRAEAARNIRRHPLRFLRNVLTNLFLFNADSTAWWLDYARYVRDGGDFRPRADPGKVFSVAVLLLGLAGLLRGLRAGETDARVVAAVYAMFCAAHGLGFMMSRYNYVRLPLVLLALPLLWPRARAATAGGS